MGIPQGRGLDAPIDNGGAQPPSASLDYNSQRSRLKRHAWQRIWFVHLGPIPPERGLRIPGRTITTSRTGNPAQNAIKAVSGGCCCGVLREHPKLRISRASPTCYGAAVKDV